MAFSVSATILILGLQATPGALPPARAATADECAVALETLRQFHDDPARLLVQDRRGGVITLDLCPGGGSRTGEAHQLLSIDVDPERGVATAVYGRCQDWYVSLTRGDGGWVASPVDYPIQDACGELGDVGSAKRR